MSYEAFVTIVLTALCALLAALAIIIGGAAIWGYRGIVESLTNDVKEKADEALKEKLKEYPAAAEMIEFRNRLQLIELLRASITPEPNGLAETPNTVQDGGLGDESQTLAQDYPSAIGS
ncbi:MAG: hypothetical protein JWQ49_2410 [Edaphobacter sp.]|nr:hypothetical protein [Edaphobacter sp.]